MKKHREGNGSKYVKAKGYEQLLESRECKNKSEASKYEYRIKQLPKEQKLEWFD
jgi:putative endonuclease